MKKALTASILVLFLAAVFIPVISFAGAEHKGKAPVYKPVSSPVHRLGYSPSHAPKFRFLPPPPPFIRIHPYLYHYPYSYPYPDSYPYSYSVVVKVLNGLPHRIEIRGEFPEPVSLEPGGQVNISLPYNANIILTAVIFDGNTVIGTATHQVRARQTETLWHITYFNRMR